MYCQKHNLNNINKKKSVLERNSSVCDRNLTPTSLNKIKSLPYSQLEIQGVQIKGVGLKLNIQKTKIMASGSITSWQTDGETVETVSDFIFLGSKITADSKCLLLGRKFVTNLDSILKSRDITLSIKVKGMVFPVVMYGCESWTVKKAEC